MMESRRNWQYGWDHDAGPSTRPTQTAHFQPTEELDAAEEYEEQDTFIPWPTYSNPSDPSQTFNSGLKPKRLSMRSFASTNSNAETFVTMIEGRPSSFVGLQPRVSIRTTSSRASAGSFVTARHNDLIHWHPVFSPSHAGKSMRELGKYESWMVSGDRLAYSESGSSDDLLIYDIGSDDSPLEPSLPWDQWQLTPDGSFILYSQGKSIHLYSLEHRRVTWSSLFEGRWVSICETNNGFVFATALGELFFWNPRTGSPWHLNPQAESTIPLNRSELQWVRCHASLNTPYCCIFGQPGLPVQVFSTGKGGQTPRLSLDGIGAQIGVIRGRAGLQQPVIAVLERQPEGLKLHMRYLEFSDDSGPDVFEPQHIPYPDGYNARSPTQTLSTILLLVEHLSCIVVLLSLNQTPSQRNPIARARIHDALDGNMIMQEDVDVDLSEIRTDGMGRILKRAEDETIERLEVSRERLKFHRQQQALSMALP